MIQDELFAKIIETDNLKHKLYEQTDIFERNNKENQQLKKDKISFEKVI